jgi:hypothetical protein
VGQNANGTTFGPDKTFTTSGVTGVDDRTAVPKQYSLYQNYPNPFNPSTLIRYQLPVKSKVTLRIFNVLGEEVKTLMNGEVQEAGIESVSFNADALPSGVYFYRLQAGTFLDVKKMLLVK